MIRTGDDIILAVLLRPGVCPRPADIQGSRDRQPTTTETNVMRDTERGHSSKKEAGDQTKAPKARSLNSLLETVRQKMAYTIRGI
ncbi:MAG TPA: hypothetical protein VH249_12615 [Xanthobacteraceae bacterium]|nr:hypothetical protein [Xanthobacteraceae bacterium]